MQIYKPVRAKQQHSKPLPQSFKLHYTMKLLQAQCAPLCVHLCAVPTPCHPLFSLAASGSRRYVAVRRALRKGRLGAHAGSQNLSGVRDCSARPTSGFYRRNPGCNRTTLESRLPPIADRDLTADDGATLAIKVEPSLATPKGRLHQYVS